MTPSRNRQSTPERQGRRAPLPAPNAGGTVLALLRVGTRRCTLAAAIVAVVVGLLSQTANGAFAEARQAVLYLDAPAVSTERASRAGEVAYAYAQPGSPANRETLAWLDVRVRAADVSTPPAEAETAFASVTAPDGEGSGGVTADAALEAGEVMIAQIETSPSEGSPSEDSPSESGGADDEMADAGTVRPQLGDGTRAPAEPAMQPEQLEPDGFDSPTDAGTPEYASTSASPALTEPNGGAGLVVPAPSSDGEEEMEVPSTELAVTPSDTGASPGLALGAAEGEPYGPTGPISHLGEGPQEPHYPDDSSPETEPTAGEEEFAQAEPVEEEPPEEEFAEADPPAVPTGAETGPTSEEGDEVALVPVGAPTEEDGGSTAPPPPADEYDDGSDDLASADPSPASEPADEAGKEQAEIALGGEEPSSVQPSEEQTVEDQSVVETQVQEVTIVQESTTGETAEAPPAAATPVDGGTNPPEEATGPPSAETPPTPPGAQTPTMSAPGSVDEPVPEPDLDLGDDAPGHSGPNTARGKGQDGTRTTPEPLAAGAGGPTDPTDQTPSATPPDGADEPTDGPQGTVNEPAAGEETPPVGQPGTPQTDTPQGDALQPPAGAPDNPAAAASRPRSGNTAPEDRRNTGNGRPVDPLDRLERRTGEADGGAEAVQERARVAVDSFEGDDAPSPAPQGRRSEERAAPQSPQRPSFRKAPQATSQRTDLRGSRTSLDTAQRGAREPAQAPGTSGRAEQTPAAAGQEDAEAELQEGSPEPQYPIGAVDGGSASEDSAAPGPAVAHERGTAEQVREDRTAERQAATAAERSAERQAAIKVERQAERRTRRRAERQAARQAERQAVIERRAVIEEQELRADRRAERQAARQASIEQRADAHRAADHAALREQRRAERVASRRAAAQQAAETQAYERPVAAQPVYREPVQQVPAQQLPPAPQVRTRQAPPADQVAPQWLAPADGGAPQQLAQQGGAQVARLGKSINPAAAGRRR